MRASDLLFRPVLDASGQQIGTLQDLRVRRDGDRLRVTAVIVGSGRLAHAWGYAEGRADGPALLRAIARVRRSETRRFPAEDVESWGPAIRLRSGARPRPAGGAHD